MTTWDEKQVVEFLSAYLDGAVTPEERALTEQRLRDDEPFARRLAELRQTVQFLNELPRHGAPASLADDVRRLLERDALVGDRAGDRRLGRREPSMYRWRPLAAAAVLAFAALGVLWGSGVLRTQRAAHPALALRSPSAAKAAEAVRALLEDAATGEPELDIRDVTEVRGVGMQEPERTYSRRGARSAVAPPAMENGFASSDGTTAMHDASGAKLAARPSIEEVRRHRFSAEHNQLAITLPPGDEPLSATRRLAASLPGVDVSAVGFSRGSAASLGERDFFVLGRSGRNFDAEQGQQVLVRIRADRAAQVVRHALALSGAGERAELRVGTHVLRGAEETGEFADQLDRVTSDPRQLDAVLGGGPDGVVDPEALANARPVSPPPVGIAPAGRRGLESQQLLHSLAPDEEPGDEARDEPPAVPESPALQELLGSMGLDVVLARRGSAREPDGPGGDAEQPKGSMVAEDRSEPLDPRAPATRSTAQPQGQDPGESGAETRSAADDGEAPGERQSLVGRRLAALERAREGLHGGVPEGADGPSAEEAPAVAEVVPSGALPDRVRASSRAGRVTMRDAGRGDAGWSASDLDSTATRPAIPFVTIVIQLREAPMPEPGSPHAGAPAGSTPRDPSSDPARRSPPSSPEPASSGTSSRQAR
jgi:anti-sigma-K factor RskA